MWVNQYGTNSSWKTISKLIPGKSEIKCHTRWLELKNLGNMIAGNWTNEEDDVLIKYVADNGPCQWSMAAKLCPGRVGKQCRERWVNHLDPNTNKTKWTIEEDMSIVRHHLIFDNRWAEIAK